MAKLVTKFKYLKPGDRKSIGGYVKYIATREGVDKIDESHKEKLATKRQQQLIDKIMHDFPDSKEMHEYDDYLKDKTVGNASEFITRVLEDNAYEMMNRKTYADYIATRPRAERFGSHGLFTDDGVDVNLKKVSDELNLHEGNVWTTILSLRREDAERLGFNTGRRWRDMLRTQSEALSTALGIPMQNLRWYAAFHNESHHPHVHLIAYSVNKSEGYLTRNGVNRLRSSFARDIFAQDLLCIYEKQTQYREELKVSSREIMKEIVDKIDTGIYDNPVVEEKLLKLADRLSKTGGKKQYGYLKSDLKALVNSIVDELAADERVTALYDLWYEQREEVIRTYTEEMPKRISLSQNKEFKSIRNAVIQEAMNLVTDRNIVEELEKKDEPDIEVPEIESDADRPFNEPTKPDLYGAFSSKGGGWREKDTWWTEEYKRARTFLYGTKELSPDFEKAFALMLSEAEKGNGFAMHDLGRMYLLGIGCEKKEELAQEWFKKTYRAFLDEEAVAKRKDYLQYRIGKLFSFGYGVEQNYEQAAMWYEKAVAAKNPFAAYALGGLYRRGQGIEQDDEKAFLLYRMAAEDERRPNAYAAYELGRMCKDGIGTTFDSVASEAWYKKAYEGFLVLEQGMADDKLFYRLGQMNLNGIGTEMDIGKAKYYFEKAAQLQNPDALYGLGKLYLKKDSEDYNIKKAVDCLMEAAQKGHAYAQYTLGRLFLKGEEVPKNVDYALRWLEEAASRENEYAQYLLGKTLLKGEEVEPDSRRGEEFLRLSVCQGNLYAAYTLGKALLDGKLLMQDIPEAIKLLTKAADQNFAPAQYALGRLFYQGEVAPQDLQKAIEYLEQAAAQEHSFAAYLVGKILLTEETVKDTLRAIRNFEIGAETGNDFAEYQLGKLYLYGKEVPRDYEKAITYLTAAAEHGNQYAVQLLHSIRNNRSWSAAMGSFRLLQHLARIIQNRLEDEHRDKFGCIDRKLRRKVDEKKQAHGQKIG